MGADRCPACGHTAEPRFARLTLFLVVVIILAGFAFTQYLVRLHRGTEQMLAQRWFSRGEAAMQAGDAPAAADDYRTALSYDRENDLYRLRLAQALLASNRLNEARSHLLSLWDEEPADGEVNLALARLYARRTSPAQAGRYYRNAINGVWENSPQRHRIATRFELIDYLMQLHDTGQASAELLALQADQPPAVSDQLRLAELLLQVREEKRAVDTYNKVLKDDPNNAQAWLGLGNASLALGDYPEAEHAFALAAEHDPASTEARQQLELVREVLRVAPSLRGLSLAERARRVADAFNAAMKRLTTCAAQKSYSLGPQGTDAPAPDSLRQLYSRGLQTKSTAAERALRSDPDSLESVMQYVFEAERTTAAICPDVSETDRALLLLAQHETESVR
jgi:tetratricopeptide (TPR) repeat protein